MACAAAMMGGTTRADLVGLRVFQEASTGGPPPPGPERWIYRVYAEFTLPGDSVSMWGIGSILGAGGIENITMNGAPGTGFTNIPDSDLGNRAPQAPFTSRDWDSYMTIGVLYGFQAPGGIDGTQIAAGTPMFIANGSNLWTGASGAAFLSDFSSPQARADYRINGNDTDTRVLLMQLVVNAGEHVRGTLGMLWRSEGFGFTTPALTFTSIPGPNSLLLLPVSIVFVRRRRRID